MSEPGGLFFLRPAKTGSSSLRAKIAAAHGCSTDAMQATSSHARTSPLAGYSGAVVLRSPLDRFVSAWHESATFGADRGCAPSTDVWPANASDFWSWLPTAYRLAPGCTTCKVFARTAPTESRLARLVGAGSPLGFARWLRRDANDRAAWISAPAHGVYSRRPGATPTVASPSACSISCGTLCGFVPQVAYAQHARYTACLPRLDADVQRILDAGGPGCRLPSVTNYQRVASNHSDGTQGAAEEKELRDHVTALYQADWDLWQERCEGTVSRIEHAFT